MILDLREQHFCIFGLKGSGKTEFGKFIVRQAERPFVIDPMDQYGDIPNAVTYVPENKEYCKAAIAEINAVINHMLKIEPLPTLFLMDEANRFCPNKRPLPGMIAYLNDESRHLELALGFIARRPVQLYTDLAELANYLVIFSLAGKNDRSYLNDIAEGFGDQIVKLPWHDFIIADKQRKLERRPALKLP